MKLHKRSTLIIWLFFSGLYASILFVLYSQGYWSKMLEYDNTGFSVLIFILFFIGWIYCIRDIAWLQKLISGGDLKPDESRVEFEIRDTITLFIIRTLVALGFLGTLIGFLIMMLSLVEITSTVKDSAKLSEHFQQALGGVGTAGLTTIVGMAGSTILGTLHLIFRVGYLRNLAKNNREDAS